jgi:hypothetical protein
LNVPSALETVSVDLLRVPSGRLALADNSSVNALYNTGHVYQPQRRLEGPGRRADPAASSRFAWLQPSLHPVGRP